MKTIPLLTKDDIEVKVKQVTEKGAVALLYKTARVDMAILDEVFGSENWTDDYKEIKGNLYCGIGTRPDATQAFVWKWDCGIESREDEEGNQKKGEASDAFKRAGFKWGIGRELYTAPFIFLNVETKESSSEGKKKTYELQNRYAKFEVTEVEYEDRKISKIIIADEKGNVVFSYPRNFVKKGITPTAITPKSEYKKAVPIQNIELNDAENFVLTFGKHNGKTLGEVDTGYIEWLAENAKDGSVACMAKSLLEARRDEHEFPPEMIQQAFTIDDDKLPF
jgi:hypothetical protein